jgi:antitoxin component YwqK of YwqJK toxin-antitoxin module
LSEETHWKDGKKDGLEQLWYESGQLWMKSNYKDGELNGLAQG